MLNKFFLALSVWFFSSALWANTWYAVKDIPLKMDRLSSAQILATIKQSESIELLTMHFSGWSKIRAGDQIGWVVTQDLTQEKPPGIATSVNTQMSADDSQETIDSLNQEIIVLKQEISNLGLSKNGQIEALEQSFRTQIEALELQNNTLEAKLDQQQPVWLVLTGEARVDSIIGTLLFLLIGLLLGLFVSKIKRRKDTFNTINRSYWLFMSYTQVDLDTFEDLVIQPSFQQLILLDISADWCGPCKVLEPIITSVIKEYDSSEVLLTKLEAEDENMKIAGRYHVRGFPTVIAFAKGIEIDRFHSAQTPDFVRNFIDTNLANF